MNPREESSHPRAVVSSRADDPRATERAITWVLERTRELGGVPLVYAPGRRNIDQNPRLSAFAKGATSATWKTLHSAPWPGGVVLAAWPDAQHLAEIDEHPRTRGLCVMTWLPKDVEPWAAATGAHQLSPGAPAVHPAQLTDRVVEQGLLTLTALVNHANALSGSLDHRDAVNVLRTLHEGGHVLDPDEIYAWALAYGWLARGAERLRDLAERIHDGQRPRADRTALRADALQRWRAAAQSPEN
ncbi:MAG: hypothetical protein KQH57_11665 [Actinomycetales bacterium]|nr:hypothetical protein [Actinomycetales bacterium]